MEDIELTTMKKYINYIIENINNEDVIAFDNHPVNYQILDELYDANIKISVITFQQISLNMSQDTLILIS